MDKLLYLVKLIETKKDTVLYFNKNVMQILLAKFVFGDTIVGTETTFLDLLIFRFSKILQILKISDINVSKVKRQILTINFHNCLHLALVPKFRLLIFVVCD